MDLILNCYLYNVESSSINTWSTILSEICHSQSFAGDSCLTYANSKLKTLESNFNFDLKNLEERLKVNRLALNAKKT